MITFKVVKQSLDKTGITVSELEQNFNANLELCLGDFLNEKEAEDYISRSEQNLRIDKRTEYQEDTGTGRGLAPVTVWTKLCKFCNAEFETTNRRKEYCDAPGHRQYYNKRKNSALLYLEVMSIHRQTSNQEA